MKIFAKERALTPSWALLRPSFELLQNNIQPVIFLSLIPALIISLGLTLIGSDIKTVHDFHERELTGLVIFVIGLVYSALTAPGLIYMFAGAAKGKQVSAWESFRVGLGRFFPLLVMNIIFVTFVMLGLIAFIIPGLIFIRRYYLAEYYVVDQKLGPLKALTKSSQDSKPVSGWVWGVIGVAFVFQFLGGIFGGIPVFGIIVGSIITYPYIFAPALRYHEIIKKV
jgi:hypothetical protein